mgnify:CR=1 FL=1
MNLTYIIGLVVAIFFMLFGMMTKTENMAIVFTPNQIGNFYDFSSILIVVGCTIAVVVASFPSKMLREVPKHFKIMFNTKRFNPMYYIDQLVELAQLQ